MYINNTIIYKQCEIVTASLLSLILVFLEDMQISFDYFCISDYLFGKMKKVLFEWLVHYSDFAQQQQKMQSTSKKFELEKHHRSRVVTVADKLNQSLAVKLFRSYHCLDYWTFPELWKMFG